MFHVARTLWLLCHEILWIRDVFVTKKWEFVTSMSQKIGISWFICHEIWGFRDLFVTKNWNFVTFLSRKWGFCDLSVTKNADFVTYLSRKWGFRHLSVKKMRIRDFYVTKNEDFCLEVVYLANFFLLFFG